MYWLLVIYKLIIFFLLAGIVTADSAARAILAVAAVKGAPEAREAANGKLFWMDGSEMPY
jgi:hypothetical protein